MSSTTPLFRTPEIFLIPHVPILNWATLLISTLIVIDVATEIADYHKSLDVHYNNINNPKKKSKKEQQRSTKLTQQKAKKLVNITALQVTTFSLLSIYLSTQLVKRYTSGIDGRMAYVLEGISRLEASHLMAYISYKTPRWIGVYHSPKLVYRKLSSKHVGVGHQGDDGDGTTSFEEELKFHVRYTIGQYFVFVGCLCLPHTSGQFLSTVLGFLLGFGIESIIVFARRGNGERKFFVASTASLVFTFLASVMFADGCHYIQVVWGSGLLFSEWGLGIATFSSALAVILFTHFYQLQRTVRKLYVERRISKHETKENTAIHLIESHLFSSVISKSSSRKGSMIASLGLSEEERALLIEEISRDDHSEMSDTQQPRSTNLSTTTDEDCSGSTATTATAKSTWALLKMRLFSPTDLIVFSKFEYYLGIIMSLASLFIVIVNIGATHQVNIVRANYSKVHDTLYGQINEGEVCAWSQIGGKIATFSNKTDALNAGFTIAHCGPCGQCSNWQDLRLQYTTRTYLAKESFRCSKKSLVYGASAVHKCLQEEPIGFSDSCARCWTEDILCARRNCAFIFLQSNMINTVSNFEVGSDTITSATCEEAMCELVFVPCSGANRRRMNITSMIARPGDQQCGIVDVDWEEIFGEGNVHGFGREKEGSKDEL